MKNFAMRKKRTVLFRFIILPCLVVLLCWALLWVKVFAICWLETSGEIATLKREEFQDKKVDLPLPPPGLITTTNWPVGRYSFTGVHFDRHSRWPYKPPISPIALRNELFDDALIRDIGKMAGVSEECISAVRLFWNLERENSKSWFGFHWSPEHNDEARVLREALQAYVDARADGHTKEFMRAVLNRSPTLPEEIEDAGIRAIVEKYPMTHPTLLRKVDSSDEEYTNIVYRSNNGEWVGEPRRYKGWAVYILVDGDIAWRYVVDFKAEDGSVYSVHCQKCDAKEYHKRYAPIIKLVGQATTAEMSVLGLGGGLGSCHTFWTLKKNKLARLGIRWRSPSELNPNTIYD